MDGEESTGEMGRP